MRKFIAAGALVGPVVVLFACAGDVSKDADVKPDGAIAVVDGGPASVDGSSREASAERNFPEGLTIDSAACTPSPSQQPAWSSDGASWSVAMFLQCPMFVNVVVKSSGLAVPRACDADTTITVTLFIPGKGKRDLETRSCTIYAAPPSDQAWPLQFEAEAIDPAEPEHVYRITYRADGPPACAPIPADQAHRAAPTECPSVRPPGDPQAREGDECTSDSACTNGLNGRCIVASFGIAQPHRQCTYDACVRDSDCAKGVCGCFSGGNVCLTSSDCKVDSDCATGRCVLSRPYPVGDADGGVYPAAISQHSEALGYFCPTAKDNCCSTGTGSGCTYDWDLKRWDWGYGP